MVCTCSQETISFIIQHVQPGYNPHGGESEFRTFSLCKCSIHVYMCVYVGGTNSADTNRRLCKLRCMPAHVHAYPAWPAAATWYDGPFIACVAIESQDS